MKTPTRLWNRVAAAFEKTGALSDPSSVSGSSIVEQMKLDLDRIAVAAEAAKANTDDVSVQEDVTDDGS